MSSEDPKFGEKFNEPAVRNSEAFSPPTSAETFDRIGSAASEFNDYAAAVEPPVNRVDNTMREDFDNSAEEIDNSPLRWIVPLVLVLLLIVLGYWFCGKSATPVSKISEKIVTTNTLAA